MSLLAVASLTTAVTFVANGRGADKGEETVRALMRQKVPPNTGELVRLATVSYAPGQASKAHEHPGAIFAYVLEGAVVSQLEGGPRTTYAKGQSWYEPPLAHHVVSQNASDKDPATLLVFSLGKEADPLTRPMPSPP